MNITIKPRRYYKRYYNEDKEWYNILYTGNKWVYVIAKKYYNKPLEKHDKRIIWWKIKTWQENIDRNKYSNLNNLEELSKGDVFLELL